MLAGTAFGADVPEGKRAKLPDVGRSAFSTIEAPNSYEDVTTYNNYYEFGTGKEDPYRNSGQFEPRPWSIKVDGHAEKTGTFHFEDFMKPFDLEERIYRMRCVEAWSMVIPWVGISLADVVKHFQPTSSAKYVAFETLNDRVRMPGQRRRVLEWPLQRGPHDRRGNQPAGHSRCWHLWRNTAEPERRTNTARRSLEVWFQGHQGHRSH